MNRVLVAILYPLGIFIEVEPDGISYSLNSLRGLRFIVSGPTSFISLARWKTYGEEGSIRFVISMYRFTAGLNESNLLEEAIWTDIVFVGYSMDQHPFHGFDLVIKRPTRRSHKFQIIHCFFAKVSLGVGVVNSQEQILFL